MTKEDPFRDGRCYKILRSVIEEVLRLNATAGSIT